jgi:hypothetical protein
MKIEFRQILNNKVAIIICSLIVVTSSCKKQTDLSTPIATATPFEKINTSNKFGWTSVSTLMLNFIGLPDHNYNTILKVVGTDNSIIFQKLQNGSTNFSTTLNIPAQYKTITVSFGGIQKTFITKNSSINMNLN